MEGRLHRVAISTVYVIVSRYHGEHTGVWAQKVLCRDRFTSYEVSSSENICKTRQKPPKIQRIISTSNLEDKLKIKFAKGIHSVRIAVASSTWIGYWWTANNKGYSKNSVYHHKKDEVARRRWMFTFEFSTTRVIITKNVFTFSSQAHSISSVRTNCSSASFYYVSAFLLTLWIYCYTHFLRQYPKPFWRDRSNSY